MYDYNFQRDKDFFKKSPTFALVSKELINDSVDEKVFNATLKLWGESIIKHNLSVYMGRIDPINLISEENSTEVKRVIGKIIFKSKDKRSDEEWKTLKQNGIVQTKIWLTVYKLEDQGIDVFSDLKKEFIEFSNKPKNIKKIKP